MDTPSRIVAQLVIGGQNKSPRIEFVQWACDHVFLQLSDYSSSLVHMATRQHPSALTSLTLHISLLSHAGLANIQGVLCWSSLESLWIYLTPFDPILSESIHQVLGAVQWSTLKSLILYGGHIDDWIQLWSNIVIDPRLLHLAIISTRSKPQLLSHLSALFVDQLVHSSPLVDLNLGKIQFEDKHDWGTIVEHCLLAARNFWRG